MENVWSKEVYEKDKLGSDDWSESGDKKHFPRNQPKISQCKTFDLKKYMNKTKSKRDVLSKLAMA